MESKQVRYWKLDKILNDKASVTQSKSSTLKNNEDKQFPTIRNNHQQD